MAIPLRNAPTRKRSVAAVRRRSPQLRVVATRRRRWPAVFVGIAIFVVIGGMLGAAVFHTQLAQRQIEIDRLERSVDEARDRFDELRRDRAVLRSPERVAEEALRLGMVRGNTSRFVSIEAGALARQIAAGGAADTDTVRILDDTDPLDQFRDVKAVSAGQP
jgi:cell division protein FtsL